MTSKDELDVVYVRTKDNPADITSRSCSEAVHVKHAARVYSGFLVLPNKEVAGMKNDRRDNDACTTCVCSGSEGTSHNQDPGWVIVPQMRLMTKKTDNTSDAEG